MNLGTFRKALAALAVALAAFTAAAIPGVTPLVPDTSGEFVYWRDYTFARESYVGLVRYDEATYGVRYAAPADAKKKLPQLSMLVLVTIDPEKTGVVEFTGEKVEPLPRSPEETDIINYLHDFIYELFPRRQALGTLTERTAAADDYEQFGGRVTIEWDPLVPVLNLRKISAADKTAALSVVTAGQLTSPTDTSFTDFAGIPAKISDNHTVKLKKKAKKADVAVQADGLPDQAFTLDDQWEEKQAGVIWALGDTALVTDVALPLQSEAQKRVVMRRLLLGTDHSYPDWASQTVTESGGALSVRQVFYDSESKSFKHDFKEVRTLSQADDAETLGIFSLTLYSGAYTKNRAYFDAIVQSYKTAE